MKKTLISAVGVAALIAGVALAQAPPARNISPGRHPNLFEAQRLSRRAFEVIVQAQKANEWDLGGHAQKAKELLEQVNEELRQAANVSNERGR